MTQYLHVGIGTETKLSKYSFFKFVTFAVLQKGKLKVLTSKT